MEYFVDVFFIVTKELLRRPPIKSAMLHCISKLFIINTPLELLKVRPLRFDSSNLNNLSIKSLYIAIWCLSSTPFLNKTRHGLWTPRESFFSKIWNFWPWADKLSWNFMRHFGYFWPNYKHYFGTVSPLSMGKSSWISFLQKTLIFRSKTLTPKCSQNKILAVKNFRNSVHISIFGA